MRKKQFNSIVIALVVTTALLAALGCWFCRHCHFFQRIAVSLRPSDMEFGEFGLMAKRGRILAADGSPLAYTVRKWRFHLDPEVAKFHGLDIQELSREIANGLDLEPGEVATAFSRKSRYVFLAECGETNAANSWFESHRGLTRRKGLIREPVQKRVYPLGDAATAVVGFMLGGAHTDTPRGAGGIEYALDKALRGVDGVYNKELPQKERNEKATPNPGADIKTTLAPEMQKAVFGALASACATNGAKSAWGIVMKVPSGDIAAMASWPSFDPSMRRDLDKWDGSMAVNRAAQVVFEPGALARPIVEAIAKDEGELPKEKLYAGLLRFGFGAKTATVGIPGEEPGFFVGPPNRWDKTTEACVGMGFGFSATGLQIAQAYATLANHGKMVRPHLLARCEDKQDVAQPQIVSFNASDSAVRALKGGVSSTVQTVAGGSYSPTNHIASYVGFCPADAPRYVVVVAFERPLPMRKDEDAARPAFVDIAGNLKQSVAAGDGIWMNSDE